MHYWIIRAGSGGKYFNDFIKNNVVALGWDIKDLSNIETREQLETLYKKTYPEESKKSRSIDVSQLWAFIYEIEKGDVVLTPNSLTKTVYIGKVTSDYQYNTKPICDSYVRRYRHRRKVSWEKELHRNIFSEDMKNSMGSLLTIFKIDKHAKEIENVLFGNTRGVAAKGKMKFPPKPKEEVTIGEPLDFEGLTNAPMEENGVIFLFGKLHERMGIRIKAIRKGFPDAIAEVWIKDRLYPRTIEFEFKSSDFKRHGHDPNKCDIIVCWEHDWRECPKNIFIIELKKELESYNI